MRYIRFSHNNQLHYGLLRNDNKVEHLIGNNPDSFQTTGNYFQLSEVKLLPPCEPSKIVCVGLNYHKHAAELGLHLPDEPVIFLKPTSSIIGPEDNIILPSQSSQVDYEAELAVVIGRKAQNISEQQSGDYIWGYTCLNDVTARDIQNKDTQWTRAKSFDTFCPIGPWIKSGISVDNLNISLLLNGETKQAASTRDMIFSVPQLISFVSRVMTLYPGDIISTGTPSGIGALKVGDKVEIFISELGTLVNYVS